MLVEAEVEGHTGYFVFDTGADALLLNSTHYPELKSSNHEFQTLTGDLTTQASQINSFKMGNLQLSDIPAFATNLNNLEDHTILPISGIIGAQIFSAEVIEIDNSNNLIKCYAQYSASDHSSVNAESRIIIEQGITLVPVTIDGKTYKFCLDTGASVSVIEQDILDELPTAFLELSRSVDFLTAEGNSEVDVLEIQEISISNLKLTDFDVVEMSFEEINKQFSNKISGILSVDQLPVSSLILDFKSSTLHFSK